MQSAAALDNGLVVVRFDTTHATGESDGSPELATITSFYEDLTDVIAWAQSQAWYAEPFILSGSSLGGITVLEYAHAHPERVKAVAPIATVISGKLSQDAYQKYQPAKNRQWREEGFVELQLHSGPVRVPWRHTEDRMRYAALAYASKLSLPVFLIVGSEDTSCPPDQQRMLYEALASKEKELHIIQGAPHSLQDEAHLSELRTRFDAWLKKIL